MIRRLAAATLLLAALGAPGGASAHPLAPSLLALEERSDGRVAERFRTPRLAARGARAEPVLPARCRPVGEARSAADAVALTRWRELDCGDAGLVGAELGARDLGPSGTDLLVHVTLADGRRLRALLSADRQRWRVPERELPLRVFADYAALGAGHLAEGLDHLLFLAGLVLLVRGGWRLAGAVTAFTAGHCLTLALAVLGVLSPPPGAVELAIAASLVVLAAELARPSGAAPSWLRRRPALLCGGFGLLHGLGFAGVLTETGLPGDAIPLALAGFNLGIELAQLALVLPLAVALAALERAGADARRRARRLPAHAIGGVGVYLALDRLTGLL